MTILPPNKIAFILDGKVLDVLHVDDRLAAIMLSKPEIADVSSFYVDKEEGFNIIGWNYDGTNITPAEIQTVVE